LKRNYMWGYVNKDGSIAVAYAMQAYEVSSQNVLGF
jgi:hypothetical protein